ncbi:MAG: hypothetical protein KDC26_04715 [Armatimonadetes bacterium]|nr:hypothetical protein [Armatimonadota bacterium]
MTGRERMVAACRGGDVDRTPVIGEDALIVELGQVREALAANEDVAILARVPSPLARAKSEGNDLYSELESNPASGEKQLDEYAVATRMDAADAIGQGADGICYVIDGAYPSYSTPMQYGGHFLELDREILGEFAQARLNMIYVAGKDSPYLDFTSDLPGHLFAWDSTSGVEPVEVKQMRDSALACDHPEANVRFIPNESLTKSIAMAEVRA